MTTKTSQNNNTTPSSDEKDMTVEDFKVEIRELKKKIDKLEDGDDDYGQISVDALNRAKKD
jgi:hypothetical protein